jgi:hypothetical protein
MLRVPVLGLFMGALALAPSPNPAESMASGETVICLWCQAVEGGHYFPPQEGECGEPSGGGGVHFHGASGSGPASLEGTICARCGGTSESHGGWQPGPCHIPCEMDPEGSALIAEAATRLQQSDDAEQGASVKAVAELLALVEASPGARYEPVLSAILMLDCQGRAIDQFRLPSDAVGSGSRT